MPRKIDGLQKHTLNLYEGDYKRIQDYYPEHGAAYVIRELIHQWVERLESKATADNKIPEILDD